MYYQLHGPLPGDALHMGSTSCQSRQHDTIGLSGVERAGSTTVWSGLWWMQQDHSPVWGRREATWRMARMLSVWFWENAVSITGCVKLLRSVMT